MAEGRAVEREKGFYCGIRLLEYKKKSCFQQLPLLWRSTDYGRGNIPRSLWDQLHKWQKTKRKMLNFSHPMTFLTLDKMNLIILTLFFKIHPAWQDMNTYVQGFVSLSMNELPTLSKISFLISVLNLLRQTNICFPTLSPSSYQLFTEKLPAW